MFQLFNLHFVGIVLRFVHEALVNEVWQRVQHMEVRPGAVGGKVAFDGLFLLSSLVADPEGVIFNNSGVVHFDNHIVVDAIRRIVIVHDAGGNIPFVPVLRADERPG